MTGWYWVTKGNKWSCLTARYNPSTCLEELKKSMKNLRIQCEHGFFQLHVRCVTAGVNLLSKSDLQDLWENQDVCKTWYGSLIKDHLLTNHNRRMLTGLNWLRTGYHATRLLNIYFCNSRTFLEHTSTAVTFWGTKPTNYVKICVHYQAGQPRMIMLMLLCLVFMWK
jgi:hypothetical protein